MIYESEFSRSAALHTRYSDESLRGIILDIHFLSQTDYLVCTFSSQVLLCYITVSVKDGVLRKMMIVDQFQCFVLPEVANSTYNFFLFIVRSRAASSDLLRVCVCVRACERVHARVPL